MQAPVPDDDDKGSAVLFLFMYVVPGQNIIQICQYMRCNITNILTYHHSIEHRTRFSLMSNLPSFVGIVFSCLLRFGSILLKFFAHVKYALVHPLIKCQHVRGLSAGHTPPEDTRSLSGSDVVEGTERLGVQPACAKLYERMPCCYCRIILGRLLLRFNLRILLLFFFRKTTIFTRTSSLLVTLGFPQNSVVNSFLTPLLPPVL